MLINDISVCTYNISSVSLQRINREFIYTNRDTGKSYVFNALQNKWRIADDKINLRSGKSIKSTHIDLSFVNKLSLSIDDKNTLRMILALKHSQGRNLTNILILLKNNIFDQLKSDNILSLINSYTYAQKKTFKTLAKWLYEYDRIRFKSLKRKSDLIVLPRKKSNHWDVRSGSLSNYEMVDLSGKTDSWSKILLNEARYYNWARKRVTFRKELKNLDLKKQEDLEKLRLNDNRFICLKQLISFRFSSLYGLRPSQIRLIMWDNFFKGEGNSIPPLLLEGECYFRPAFTKQVDDESKKHLAEPRVVPDFFLEELSELKKIISYKLKNFYSDAGFSISPADINKLVKQMPVIPRMNYPSDLTSFNTKDALTFSLRNQDTMSLKCDIAAYLKSYFKLIEPESDRLTKKKYKLSANRFRHTLVTNMISEGYEPGVISAMLCHTDENSFLNYVDIPADVQHKIDTLRDDADFLVNAANGMFSMALRERITDSISENEKVIEELNAGILGKSASLPMCRSCKEAKPVCCYGCINFRPLISANHHIYLTKMVKEYYEKINNGYSKLALSSYESIIKKIRLTIYHCEILKKSLTVRRGDEI
ncbi:TPA: hypothetical protein JAN03_14930 [Citrobacter freundii]|nr:hypothetical protein [Citrobacter freundii]